MARGPGGRPRWLCPPPFAQRNAGAAAAPGRSRQAARQGGSYCGSMSNPNVALVYEILGAYQQGDEEKLRSLMHPEAEVYGAPGLINAGTYHGYEGFRGWLEH